MKPHSRTSKKLKPKQSVNQTTPKIQQNSNPKLDNQGLSSRMAHPDTLTPADVLQLQRTIGNQATRHLIQREGDDDKPKGLGGKYSETMAMLENHIGSKAKQRDLLTQDKAGQGMAKDITNQGMDGLLGQQDATASQNETISKGFQRLVEFSRFDDSANVSVLKSAEDGGLKDDQKWSVVVANSDFMKYIQKGMTINKIIPDHQVKNILGIKHNNEGSGQQSAKGTIAYGGNKVGGSVAHEQNYDGLSGSQSVSNFGLDYGGYTDTDKDGKKVKLQGNEAVDDYTWGGLSSYVKESGDGKLQGVENVFYVKVKIPDKEMDKVKVPIHQNIIDFASQKKAEITGQLASYPALIQQAEENGANITEIIRSLKAKLVILDRFLKYALFSSNQWC